MKNIFSILQSYWGYDAFRPMQQEIVESVLNGNDTLALLPTGGGKSLCFQVPAMAMDGLCLVVSPLIALMKDQVQALRKRNITAFALTAEMNRSEVRQILEAAAESNCKFLYVSPERIQTVLFQEFVYALDITLIAVDEAHCISQWGYDFRPPYLKIASLREHLPDVPIIAVTASATPAVQQDICAKLELVRPYIFRGSFLRPALSFRAFCVPSKTGKLIDLLRPHQVSALVYCKSRKKTVEIAQILSAQGIRADFYHAGLSGEERKQKQESWMRNEVPVMACTNAFGMGIDKPDVRMVIHYDMPDCLENYYQEAGRAGRDGQKSYAILLYEEKDITELNRRVEERFPDIAFIRHVYRCLANYFQVPAGSEAEEWKSFDWSLFIERFELPAQATLYAFQLLEQEGWIQYATRMVLSSRLVFTANKETLERFETTHPELEPVMKALLRGYGGILDVSVNISEWNIAKALGWSKEMVTQALHSLHQLQLVNYQPHSDGPQIRFPESRPVSDEWLIQPAQLLFRKDQFEKRAAQMIHYATNKNLCRSVIMGNYFGDDTTENCGICDHCVAQKKKHSIDYRSFQDLRKLLREEAGTAGLDIRNLIQSLPEAERENVMELIRHLMQEEEVMMNDLGRLFFRASPPA